MKKQEFLKKLEETLHILDTKERKEILDEYRDMIAEKMKNGQTEEEAIADFGNLNDLSKEILKAYKINPEFYEQKKDPGKEFLKQGETLIQSLAQKLSSVASGVIDSLQAGDGITMNLVFEIIIKVFVFVIAIGLLRIPFYLITAIGNAFLVSPLFPFTDIFELLWQLLIWIIYLFVCIGLGIAVFKQYIKPEEKMSSHQKKSTTKSAKTSSYVQNRKTDKSDHAILEVIMIIVKICVIIGIIIPISFINVGLLIGLLVLFYLLAKGVSVIGLLLLIIGLSIGMNSFLKAMIDITFRKKKPVFYPIILSFFIFLTGGILFIQMLSGITYTNEGPTINYGIDQKIYEEVITEPISIAGNQYTQLLIDDELADGMIRVEIDYYSEYSDVSLEVKSIDQSVLTYFITHSYDQSIRVWQTIEWLIEDLKNNQLYDYTRLDDYKVRIYTNSDTKAYIDYTTALSDY